MKLLSIASLLLTLTCFLSCSNNQGESDTFWECTIDGNNYRTTGTLAYAVRFDVDNTIAVYGSEDPLNTGYRNVFIATKDEGKVGKYDLALGGDAVGTLFNSDGSNTYISGLGNGSGTMEITSINEEFVEGVFEFIGEDGNGAISEIKDGSFKVKFSE